MGKRVLFGTFGYTFSTFLLGATWHFVLFEDLYHRLGAYNRQELIIPLGFLSMLLQGVILSYLFQYVHKGVRPIREGLAYALVMGIYMYTTTTIAFAAKTELSSEVPGYTARAPASPSVG